MSSLLVRNLTFVKIERDGTDCRPNHAFLIVVEFDRRTIQWKVLEPIIVKELQQMWPFHQSERDHLQEGNEVVDDLNLLIGVELKGDKLVQESMGEEVNWS